MPWRGESRFNLSKSFSFAGATTNAGRYKRINHRLKISLGAASPADDHQAAAQGSVWHSLFLFAAASARFCYADQGM